MSINGSIYPPAVEDLVPKVAALAEEIGELPSRNRIMKDFRVGSPKATAVLEALTANPGTLSSTVDAPEQPVEKPMPHVEAVGHPEVAPAPQPVKKPRKPLQSWPVALIALPAAVAIWSGWVGLGGLTGFGEVNLLPGIVEPGSWATINSAITLPIGVEAYAAFALKAWLSGSRVPHRARRFARWSAIASLIVGSAGQVAYHVMESAGMTAAPWWITTLVACLPVAVLGMGAALAHLLNLDPDEDQADA